MKESEETEKFDLYFDIDYAERTKKVNLITFCISDPSLIGKQFTQLDYAGRNIRNLPSKPIATNMGTQDLKFKTIDYKKLRLDKNKRNL